MKITDAQFQNHMQEIEKAAMEAMESFASIEEQFADAAVALSTVPRLSTRLKMALIPGRWPHVEEPRVIALFTRLHSRLAGLMARARMLKGLSNIEDSQTEAGNAEERTRTLTFPRKGYRACAYCNGSGDVGGGDCAECGGTGQLPL